MFDYYSYQMPGELSLIIDLEDTCLDISWIFFIKSGYIAINFLWCTEFGFYQGNQKISSGSADTGVKVWKHRLLEQGRGKKGKERNENEEEREKKGKKFVELNNYMIAFIQFFISFSFSRFENI